MARWLQPSSQVRAVELLGEFVRLSAQAGSGEESLRHACELLAEHLQAKVVVLFRLDPRGKCLQPLAASAPEWELTGEFALEGLPEWQAALEQTAPRWVEQTMTPTASLVSPLLEVRSALLLPLLSRGRAYGCLAALFEGVHSPTGPEESEFGETLAHTVALQLEARALREELEAREGRFRRRRRLEADLQHWGFSPPGVARLLAAMVEEGGVEVAGLFELLPNQFRQVAAAGATHLLPENLPRDSTNVFPWQRALAEGRALEARPPELTAALQPWLPQLAQSGFHLGVVPLGPREAPLGLLLLGGSDPLRSGGDEHDWIELSLLAAAALVQHRGQRLQERTQGRYQALFDHVPEGVFLLDASGRIRAANPALLRALGYTPEEFQQPSLADFLPLDDWENLCAWLYTCPRQPFAASVRWQAKSGDWRPFELTIHSLPDPADEEGLHLAFARDTAGEHSAEARARLSEACLSGVLDSVHDGLWLIGTDGTVERANHRLAQLFGVNLQELGPGLPQSTALERLKRNFADSEKTLARWAQLQTQPDQVGWDEFELLAPRRRVLERFARPLLDTQQQLIGRVEVYRDITDRRLLEDKVAQRERLVTLGHLVSGLAHELNNPLTAVTGYAELLLANGLPAEFRQKLERLHEEAERASRVVKSLLLFARGDKAEKQRVDLNEVLERALSLRTYALTVKNIQLVRDLAQDLPPVLADPTQLQQVFLNLLLNAEQAIHSWRQHGRLTVRTRWQAEQERLRVEISDDGPGISAPILPYIFDPFFTTKAASEGTGLGLSISQSLVKEHGGEIGVASNPGQGTTFSVELPPQLAPAPVRPRQRARTRRPLPMARTAGQRILVVDDEPVVAHFITDALRRQGYRVRVHTDSRRALEEACRQPFALVICDVRMPELDGPAFYRVLRERKPSLARRLLFTTGDTVSPETARFLEQVQLPYLAKPFHVDELQTVVNNFLYELDETGPGERKPPAA